MKYGEYFGSSKSSGSEFLFPRKALRGCRVEEGTRSPEMGNIFGPETF